MNAQFTLTLTVTGANLQEIDDAIIQAAGQRITARMVGKDGQPVKIENMFNVKGTVSPPINPTVTVVEPIATKVEENVASKKGRRPGGVFNKETRKYEYPEKPIQVIEGEAEVEEAANSKSESDNVVYTEPSTSAESPKEHSFTVDDAIEALKEVNSKFNIDEAKKCLDKFNVKRCKELKDSDLKPFVEHCKEVCKTK